MKKGGWKEIIEETNDEKCFDDAIDAVVDKYGHATESSYRAIIKYNGGYGKNHEEGATIDVNWIGALGYIWDIIRRSKPKDEALPLRAESSKQSTIM